MRDIHWVIERQHEDGTWEAVRSQFGEWARNAGPHTMNLNSERFQNPFCQRDESFFEAFTDFDGTHAETVADFGLPDDISPYARDHLEWKVEVIVNDRPCPILYGHSWCHLGRLRFASSGQSDIASAQTQPALNALRHRTKMLEDLLQREETKVPLLQGKSYDSDTQTHNPDMVEISAHRALRLIERSRSLKPVANDTVRLLVAYDS